MIIETLNLTINEFNKKFEGLYYIKPHKGYPVPGIWAVCNFDGTECGVLTESGDVLKETPYSDRIHGFIPKIMGVEKTLPIPSKNANTNLPAIQRAPDIEPISHIKIWFPVKGSHPLGGVINEQRFIRQSKLYQGRKEKLSLLTHFDDNEPENSEYVQSFCKANEIDLITTQDIYKELTQTAWVDQATQLSLFEIAMAELTHPAGNPVIASDIFRLLSPVLKRGAYSDIDAKIELGVNHQYVDSKRLPELLFNYRAYISFDKLVLEDLNTNFLYAKNTEHRLLVERRKCTYVRYMDTDWVRNLDLNSHTEKLSDTDQLAGTTILVDKAATEDYRKFVNSYFDTKIPTSVPDILEFRQKIQETIPQHYQAFLFFYVQGIAGPLSFSRILSMKCSMDPKFAKEIPNYSMGKAGFKLVNENATGSDLSWLKISLWGNQEKLKTEHSSKKTDPNEPEGVTKRLT